MPASPHNRLAALTAHLPSTTMSSTTTPTTKAPITCHVLDTTLGRPAASIPVTLTLHNPPSSLSASGLTFRGTTNADGRVTAWEPSSPFSSDALDVVFKRAGDQRYSLTFDTETYFGERGVETFFPEVEVKFVAREGRKGEHFHVPVLLSGFGYTTYRGS